MKEDGNTGIISQSYRKCRCYFLVFSFTSVTLQEVLPAIQLTGECRRSNCETRMYGCYFPGLLELRMLFLSDDTLYEVLPVTQIAVGWGSSKEKRSRNILFSRVAENTDVVYQRYASASYFWDTILHNGLPGTNTEVCTKGKLSFVLILT